MGFATSTPSANWNSGVTKPALKARGADMIQHKEPLTGFIFASFPDLGLEPALDGIDGPS
jgi:hypothetical protein